MTDLDRLTTIERAEGERGGPIRTYRYYDLIMAAFVTVLLCSNLISASKQVSVGGFVFGAGVLFFPVSYLFGDVLTEVYGCAVEEGGVGGVRSDCVRGVHGPGGSHSAPGSKVGVSR